MKPNIFQYDDYREFLKELYSYLKKSKKAFSYRFFARQAGFTSPNFLKLVIDGKRNLTAESIPKFSRALGLNQQESEFFESLVHFNQSSKQDDKNLFFEKMIRNRRFREIRELARDQFEYYSNWYYSAVRELVTIPGFKDDPEWIAGALVPAISAKQAKSAMDLLVRLNLLRRSESGKWLQTDALITPGPDVQRMVLVNLHREMLGRASDALETVPSEERDVSAVTLGIPASKMNDLKARIDRFRRELLSDIASSTAPNDRVYQFNVQLFPLSKEKKK